MLTQMHVHTQMLFYMSMVIRRIKEGQDWLLQSMLWTLLFSTKKKMKKEILWLLICEEGMEETYVVATASLLVFFL